MLENHDEAKCQHLVLHETKEKLYRKVSVTKNKHESDYQSTILVYD